MGVHTLSVSGAVVGADTRQTVRAGVALATVAGAVHTGTMASTVSLRARSQRAVIAFPPDLAGAVVINASSMASASVGT